jgi:hypothetical protein
MVQRACFANRILPNGIRGGSASWLGHHLLLAAASRAPDVPAHVLGGSGALVKPHQTRHWLHPDGFHQHRASCVLSELARHGFQILSSRTDCSIKHPRWLSMALAAAVREGFVGPGQRHGQPCLAPQVQLTITCQAMAFMVCSRERRWSHRSLLDCRPLVLTYTKLASTQRDFRLCNGNSRNDYKMLYLLC